MGAFTLNINAGVSQHSGYRKLSVADGTLLFISTPVGNGRCSFKFPGSLGHGLSIGVEIGILYSSWKDAF